MQQLTQHQVESDLARLPPGATASASSTTTRGLSELAQVLLHQQCRALLREDQQQEQKDTALAARIAEVRAELIQSQSQPKESDSGETEEDPSSGLRRMADALEEEAEEPDKEMYLRVLKAQGMLPMTVPLPRAETAAGPAAATGADGSEHQLMRDLERDHLELNGCAYKPGLGGYARVVQWLRGAMEARLQECLPPPGEGDVVLGLEDLLGGGACGKGHHGGAQAALEAFAKELLRRINRTHSAGVSYERLTQALGVEGVTRIVPDSAAAEPLAIELDVGAFPLPTPTTSKANTKPSSSSSSSSSSSTPRSPLRSPQRANSKQQEAAGGGGGDDDDEDWAWGLRARLRTATSYSVFDDAVEEAWLGARVAYRETVCLPLVLAGGRGGGGVGGGGGAVSLGARVRMEERG